MIPDIAIGAIAAAGIGALISLLGLIVSKESKVSEFRQAWIDALRSELSSFMSNVNAVMETRDLTFVDANKRFETLQPYTGKLNESYYMVAFRLNGEEETSKKLKSCMIRILKILLNDGLFNSEEFETQRVNFITLSNCLLKEEWNRVKSGEAVYRGTRWIASIVLMFLIGLGAFATFLRNPVIETKETIATGSSLHCHSDARQVTSKEAESVSDVNAVISTEKLPKKAEVGPKN